MIPALENLLVKTPDNRVVVDETAWQTAQITACQTHPAWARFEQVAKHHRLSETDTLKLLAIGMLDMSVALAEQMQKMYASATAVPGPIILTGPQADPAAAS